MDYCATRRLLDPIDRLGETTFAVLMMLTFTLAFAFLELDADPNKPVSVADVHELLFFAGYHWGKYSGINPFKTGLLLLGIGIVLALVAIPLGG
jgi:VIT1/CCC1 family predicted Fe2+/Mn2+ transporter